MKSDLNREETVQNLSSTDKEKQEKSALLILKDIRKKIEEIGDPPYTLDQNRLNEHKQLYLNPLFCSACLLPIQNGDLAYCLNCCNCFCHLSCLAQIAEFDTSTMEHQCPNCSLVFPTELIQRFISMQQIIDGIRSQS